MNGDGIPYGGALSIEQRLARMEQIVIAKSIGTAKGATIAFSASGTPVEVPAAAGNGYGLISDTSQSGGVAWQQPLHCFVHDDSSTVVTIPIATWTAVPFDDELFDVGGLHSTSSNTNRINLSRAGVWEVGYQLLWLSSTGYTNGAVVSQMLLNGAGRAFGYDRVETWGGGKSQQPVTKGTAFVVSNGSDWISTYAYCHQETSIAGTTGGYWTSFRARYLGPST